MDIAATIGVFAAIFFAVDRLQRFNTLSFTGKPVVHDGDTLSFEGERIRLRGIDAPEFDQQCEKEGRTYSCGREARAVLRRLVGGEGLSCQGYERDKYDRLLARCTVGGRDLGETLVSMGWAVAYGDYEHAEAEARAAKRGLWAGDFAPPREWREQKGIENADGPILNWIEGLIDQVRRIAGRWLKGTGDEAF